MKRARAFIVVLVFMCGLLGEAFYSSQKEISNHIVSDEKEQDMSENVMKEDIIEEGAEQESVEQEHVEQKDTVQESTVQKDIVQKDIVQKDTVQNSVSLSVSEVEDKPAENIHAGALNVVAHTPIAEQDYYQYSSLNDMEKTIYQAIVQAIKASDTVVNLSKYSCSRNTLYKIYECIMADYPQFFYLAKNSAYICDSTGENVKKFILMYTDGTTTDQYNKQGKRVVTANRSTISEQVSSFRNEISEILASISASGSDLEKERSIYEFIQGNVTYDSQAATLIYGPEGTQIPHAFDAYGALCEGAAVCEGYAKLFQYLCYCVGIQATQIYGNSSNQPHMWNAVKIGDDWYMSDVTWDDIGRDDLYCYNYFNLTTNQITSDHAIDSGVLKVPNCTAETYAFYNQYALYVSDVSMPPTNYQQVIDCLVKNGDRYLYVYMGNPGDLTEEYFVTHILKGDSAIQQYIGTINYAIELKNEYMRAGNYGYIPLK